MKKNLFVFVCFVISMDAALAAPPSGAQGELRILSWNIKMLPRFLAHIKHHPVRRARVIPEVLLKDSIDVICFQEAFDGKCNRILHKKLSRQFPYKTGPANNQSGKLSSGVSMYSRYPMKWVGERAFATCEKEDCFAMKGGLLSEVNKDGMVFRILGTHCEAGGDPALKISQYHELAELAARYGSDTVPLFYVGDFNTRKTDPLLYPELLRVLKAEDRELSGELQCTSDNKYCDMGHRKSGSQKVIDYILEGRGVNPWRSSQREVRRYQARWHKSHLDLSDHYAVYAVCRW
jgi:exonuclease III